MVTTLNAEPDGRRWSDLPSAFFYDYGKSARKYVLGALKAYYWLEQVAWRNHTRQAIEWRWVAPVEGAVRVPLVAEIPYVDPYLTEDPSLSRATRIAQAAETRREAFEQETQLWIDHHYPEAAKRYRFERKRRESEREQKRKADAREARRWEKHGGSGVHTGHQF